MWRHLPRPRQTILISLIVLALILAGSLFNLFEFLELRGRDLAFQLRGAQSPNSPVIIVAIDDESFAQTQMRWPWSRAYFAQMIERLAAGKPRGIVLDVLLYEPAPDDDQLARALADAGNVILANSITTIDDPNYQLEQLNLPVASLAQAARGLGLSNIERDRDSFVRRLLAFQRVQGETYYHWALLAAALFFDAALPAQPSPQQLTLGAVNIPLADQQLAIAFRGPPRTFTTIPAYQVVNGDVPPEKFRDAIVLVGATSETLHDTYPTPFNGDQIPMPGVEIGANALDTILSQRFVYALPPAAALFLIFVAGGLGSLLTFLSRPLHALLALVGLVLAYILVWYAVFGAASWQLPLFAPESALFLCFVAPTIVRAVEEEAAKRRVRHLFEQFIAPEMVDELIARGVEGARGRRAELTILFADLRGFTSLSEKLAPDELVRVLNEYLAAMTDVIFRHRGTIDKFEGDAILAFWGAPASDPDHARRATRAALEMQNTLEQLHARWSNNPDLRTLKMGIGLNTGEAFVGLVGSARRVNYTVIGDTVNLAARLQDLTKEYGAPLLISEATGRQLRGEFDAEFVATRTVKGKTVAVNIYRVLGFKSTRAAVRAESSPSLMTHELDSRVGQSADLNSAPALVHESTPVVSVAEPS